MRAFDRPHHLLEQVFLAGFQERVDGPVNVVAAERAVPRGAAADSMMPAGSASGVIERPRSRRADSLTMLRNSRTFPGQE